MTDSESPRPSRRTVPPGLLWSFKILVSGGLLYLLLARVDLGQLWAVTRTASWTWLVVALACYLAMVLISAWRWGLLLVAQHVPLCFWTLTRSFLVATFFNNFLPSNIGGDVVRIRDTSRAAGSKTLATTVVLVDRGIGLLGLAFVAASGATFAASTSSELGPFGPGVLWMAFLIGIGCTAPMMLRPDAVGRLLAPLRVLHQEWVGERISRLTDALGKFRESPSALLRCFVGAICVQATLVAFYAAAARALAIPIPLVHLAVLIPLSFIVQMAPVSVNGFGVREATFGVYFARLGLPLEAALALSFVGAVLMMIFSVSGAVEYLARGRRVAADPPV